MSSSQITILPEFLSAIECNTLLRIVEQLGFDIQYSGDSRKIRSRCQFEHPEWSDLIWNRLAPEIPSLSDIYTIEFPPEPVPAQSLDEYQPCGVNEQMRCYKYGQHEEFRRHQDFSHQFNPEKRTFYTVLIYLNDGFSGGETLFEGVTVTPVPGTLVMFPHELEHEGRPVQNQAKYTLRTDVVFSC